MAFINNLLISIRRVNDPRCRRSRRRRDIYVSLDTATRRGSLDVIAVLFSSRVWIARAITSFTVSKFSTTSTFVAMSPCNLYSI